MSGNTFGRLFRLTTFGESHGRAVGGVIDGCPPGLHADIPFIERELARRKPGQSDYTTPRGETDSVIFSSGILEGMTTGTPIGFWILNTDQHEEEYDHLRKLFRPSHADLTYQQKYGIRDHRGGGRASARETVSRVVAGAFAKLLLMRGNITVQAYVSSIGPVSLTTNYTGLSLDKTEDSPVRCPDPHTSAEMEKYLQDIMRERNSTGGTITCIARHVPPGLGEPVFDKLQAALAHAMLSIPAVKGFEYGSGFEGTTMKGSEHNDPYALVTEPDGSVQIRTLSNRSGGIQGGISSGEDIFFRVAFKPISTIGLEQLTLDDQGRNVRFTGARRYDPCPVPRAVVIVEAMTALVLADYFLMQKCMS